MGVNTSLGIIAGVGGAIIAADIVILSALIGMFTGAKAMAVQNYLAVKSQRQILESEIKRERFARSTTISRGFQIIFRLHLLSVLQKHFSLKSWSSSP
jgi:VIT1/CCC1 family predicted Fe2+/Mn2+ transporter